MKETMKETMEETMKETMEERVERIAGDLEDLPIHTLWCPDDCTPCIAADLLRELGGV